MRILFVADVRRDPDAGSASTELQTIRALRELGHAVDEVWADEIDRRIRHGNLHYAFELPRAYWRVIREHRAHADYDVIHVNLAQCYLAARDHKASSRHGVFVGRTHGLEDNMEEHLRPFREALGIPARRRWRGLPGRTLQLILRRQMRLAARHVDGYVVSCSLDREYLISRHGMDPDRVACIPTAPAEAFVKTPAVDWSPERSRHLLYVAGFGYVKGPHAMAAAVNALAEAGEPFRFTWLCRKTDHPKAEALLAPAARKRTTMLDWVTQDRLRAIYDSAGVLLYPSLFDGFGNVFLEAMARGLCVVGTPVGGMRDILRHQTNGMLAERNSPETLVACVRRLWDDPMLAGRLSREAVKTARDFTSKGMASEAAGFYETLLTRRRSQK